MIKLSLIGMSGAGKSHWSQKFASAGFHVIGVDDPLARLAGELAETYGLRGYDAVHLASTISIEG